MSENTRWGATPEEWAHFSFWLDCTADLLPVVSNPNAVVSPSSKLKTLGKVPSKYNTQHQVVGLLAWTQKQSTEAQVHAWSAQEDYGICVQTRYVRALDLDVADAGLALEIAEVFEKYFGPLPKRVRSNTPRMLLPYRLVGAVEKRVFKVKDNLGMVEALMTGQQFVACGTHPSGARYEWEGGLPDNFPEVTLEALDQAWAEAKNLFADPEWVAQHGGERTAVARSGKNELALQGQHDPVVDWLDKQGWIREIHSERIFIWCPWREGHSSDSGPTETEYFRAGTGGYELGRWLCLHASCAHRTREDLLEEIGFAHAIAGEFEEVLDEAPETTPCRTMPDGTLVYGDLEGLCDNDNELVEPGGLTTLKHTFNSVVEWRSAVPGEGLKRTKKGFVASLDNLCRALDTEGWWVRLGYDTFRCEIMKSTWAEGRYGVVADGWTPWTDNDYGRARRALENAGFEPVSADLVRVAVGLVADERQFDSAQMWLGSRPAWDGVARVETFFSAYMGVSDTEYSRACGRYLWSALAGRVLQPGVKADMVPILVGPQGYGKSTGLEAIAPGPEWVVGVDLSKQDAELSRRVRGKNVVVLSELRGLKSRELEAILDWVTQTHDTWTPKYKEYGVQNARRFVLVGCCNPRGVGIFDDESGNRRWLPMTVGRLVDVAGVRRDREQLWAEAVALFEAEGVLWKDAERLARDEHADYEVESQWEGMVVAWLAKARPADFSLLPGQPWSDGGFSLDMVLTEACGLDIRQVKMSQTHEVARVLRKHGYDNIRKRFGGGVRVRRWSRDDGEE